MIKNIIFLALVFTFSTHAQKIKIACVGNSVTYGLGIKKRVENSYPTQLQQLLGNTYEVANFLYK